MKHFIQRNTLHPLLNDWKRKNTFTNLSVKSRCKKLSKNNKNNNTIFLINPIVTQCRRYWKILDKYPRRSPTLAPLGGYGTACMGRKITLMYEEGEGVNAFSISLEKNTNLQKTFIFFFQVLQGNSRGITYLVIF